ncbi:MAG TPA: hypothetical protein VF442_09970 [Sphingobium sp.]
MIQISTLPFRRLLIAELSGFLTVEDVADFERQKVTAARAMGLGSGEFDLLVDTVQCDIQPQDVIAAFQHMITNTPCRARRVALVHAASLARMQAKRALNRDNVALVDTRAEALDWLTQAAMAAA